MAQVRRTLRQVVVLTVGWARCRTRDALELGVDTATVLRAEIDSSTCRRLQPGTWTP